MFFITFYSNWVKKVPNSVWSSQQADFINSLMVNAQNYCLSSEQYLKIVDVSKKNKKTNK
jgi:hypothetical protein